MLRRILHDDEYYRLSVGIFGGILIEDKRRAYRLRVPMLNARYFHRVMAHYQALGGKVTPEAEGMSWIVTRFLEASLPGGEVYSRMYYRRTPQEHAQEAAALDE